MSNALAIAGVTRVLRELLNDGLVSQGLTGLLGTTVDVTTFPPDRIPTATNGAEATLLNLFLRQVSPNLGYRNEGLASVDAAGRTRLSNPPLALDLHYLVSAHAQEELHAEILLGHAMLLLHQSAIIPRLAIRAALKPTAVVLPPALAALGSSGLEEQVEQLRITPEHLNSEELSKFWTATQAHYRQCAGYHVSVVLLQATEPTHKPLPVLEPRVNVEPSLGFSFPALDAVASKDGQGAATIGTPIVLEGHDLGAGGGRDVVLTNERLVLEATKQETGTGTDRKLEFVIPIGDAGAFPVGVYRVGVHAPTSTGTVETNHLAFVLAPKVTALSSPTSPSPGVVTFQVSFLPEVRPEQVARVVMGQREFSPDPFTGQVSSLSFTVADLRPGSYLVRLRVDGIDSSILDLSGPTPGFDNNQRIVIP